MKVLHDWLKDYCGSEIPTTSEIEKLFTFHAFEVDGIETLDGHEVIDVKILPDRASDCLSHRGIARELATLTNKPLIHDPLTQAAPLTPRSPNLKISIADTDACRRFALAHVTGVRVAPSPKWLASRLEALGQRSINNIVDATNYVMFALGQPLHAYDAGKFAPHDGVWHFGVRMARDGEVVTTLSGDTLTLSNTVQLIVNGHDDAPVGIAGIKGGKSAEVTEGTTDIILEAANFDPQITRKASQLLKLQTDAAKRFENNLSPELVPYALSEVVKLIVEIAGGVCQGFADEYPAVSQNKTVLVSLHRINDYLGVHIADHDVENIFNRLGFSYTQTGDAWEITAPRERADICIPEDVIAEVGRVYGYEHIEPVLPEIAPLTEYNARYFYGEKIKSALIALGFSEIITSSFCKKDAIELQNALASDKRFVRSTLIKNVQETLDRNISNIDFLARADVRVFEIGTVFEKTLDGKDVTEYIALAIGARTKQQGYTPKDDQFVSDALKQLETLLGVPLSAHAQNGVLECNLSEIIQKLPQPTAYEAYIPVNDTIFKPYSTFPCISRDIALWVPESTSADDIEKIIQTYGGALLVKTTLFDEFKKEGKVSYAFRLVFQSMERTLTDDEVGQVMGSLTAEFEKNGFEVR